MSYLLYMDESGHDHKNTPYEIHGGIVLHASKVWDFIQEMRALEREAFGAALHEYGAEIKGAKLLEKKRFQWAAQEADPLPDLARRQHARSFLQKSHSSLPPSRSEFTAYGQASLKLARGILPLLRRQEAALFAVAIPRGTNRVPPSHNPENLRRDWVYLVDRYSLFLQEKGEHSLLVQDHIEKSQDRRFTQQLERYFSLTQNGRRYARHVVPTPLFVTSDMTYAIQAADVCLYALNWGFRRPEVGMDAPDRAEIADWFGAEIAGLQWRGTVEKEGKNYSRMSICYIAQLYADTDKRKEGNAAQPTSVGPEAEPPPLL